MPRCRPIRSLINQVRSFCKTTAGSPLDQAVEQALAPVRRAFASDRFVIEPLEQRQLLTTITGSGVMEYKDAGGGLVRLRWHNLTAELVFARVSLTNQVTLGDHTPAGAPQEELGKDLYHIYVAESSVDSFMAIARVPNPAPNTPRPMQPFGAGVAIRHANLNTGDSVTTDSGPGEVLIGARTRQLQGGNNTDAIPLLNRRFTGLGILGERPNGRLNAGVTVAPGQDFGRMFIGGTVLGQVTFQGSIDQFYAGALLTGNAEGLFSGDSSDPDFVPQNFYVAGDIRDLFVGGTIGGLAGQAIDDPSYLTGFEMIVKGTVGQIHVHDDFFGTVDAQNLPDVPHLRLRQREIEFRNNPAANRGSNSNFEGLDTPDGLPRLGDNNGIFNNDSFDAAQYLGTFDSRIVGKDGIHVNGQLQATQLIRDMTDYYGVPLMAGQSITVRLVSAIPGVIPDLEGQQFATLVNVGVFDPTGRLIATDYDDSASLDFEPGKTFTITADRPGVYRVAIGVSGDFNFDNDTVDAGDQLEPGPQRFIPQTDYQIQITGAGNLSLGALFVQDNFFDATSGSGGGVFVPGQPIEEVVQRGAINAQNGDLGAVNSNGVIASLNSFGTIGVQGGNLRSLDATSLGFEVNNGIGSGPSLYVPDGGVGLIRARVAGGSTTLTVQNAFKLDFTSGPIDDPTDFDNELDAFVAIGGDIQMVHAQDELDASLITNKAIGTIRADAMDVTAPSIFAANADEIGNDGIIDLIDIAGQMGTLGGGGPHLSTGPGGNVRYIRVGGAVFRDNFFGSGQPELQVFEAGERATFVDDSGAQMLLTPIPLEKQVNFQTGEVTFVNPGTLTAQFYPVRGSGGGALISVTSTRGLQVDVNGGNAEIGRISVSGAGAGITTRTTDVFGNPIEDDELILDPNSDEDLSLILNSSGVLDVLTLQGGNFNRILNRSSGEIVNVNASSIGTIAAKTLGIAKHHTAAAVLPNVIDFGLNNGTLGISGGIGNSYPLTDERIGVVVSGDVVLAQASNTIGNFLVGGRVQTLVANSDQKFTSGVFEGIDGNVLVGREIRLVNIGEGLAHSGTGNVSHAGIYADGRIVKVVNQGLASDIHGDIVSRGQSIIIEDPNTGRADPRRSGGVVLIQLVNGSIIDSDILVTGNYQMSREMTLAYSLPDAGGITTSPVFEIGTISLSGVGGIIGTNLRSSDIGNIVVSGGFGIINSQFSTPAQGAVQNMTADGYGVRNTFILGGGSLGTLDARGGGKRLSALGFSPTVRFSEKKKFDPYSGRSLTPMNDLHQYLGTTAANPIRLTGARSVSGIIDGVFAAGGRTANNITGHRINASSFAYANGIDQMIARDSMDTVDITTGRLDLLKTGTDMERADITVAGPVGTVAIGGSYRGTNEFVATGPDGFINIFATKRSLFGAVRAQKGMNEVRVGTDIGSPSIESSGNINAIRVNGNILAGSFIRSARNILNLVVTGNIEEGAIIVADDIDNQSVGGDVFGDIQIG